MAQTIVLFGAGGHASDVLGILEEVNRRVPGSYEVLGLVADHVPDPARFQNRSVPYLGASEACRAMVRRSGGAVMAIGYPGPRERLWREISMDVASFPTLVHPDSTVDTGVELGEGSVVLPGVRISPRTTVGAHASLGRQAVLGHDVVVGEFSSIMPAATISGDVRIGRGALIGSNATVLEGLTIGEGSTVGAGSLVVRNVPPGVTVLGVPAQHRDVT